MRFTSNQSFRLAGVTVSLLMPFALPAYAADPCLVPDNGDGTAALPPVGCQYTAPNDVMYITEGLPIGSTLELVPTYSDFTCPGFGPCTVVPPQGICEAPGGTLGGDTHCYTALLQLDVTGTGGLAGFNRILFVQVHVEVHTAPRTPGDPIQSFDTGMFRLEGELFGDPDFCTFRVRAGSDLGLPSPGHMTLTEQSGNFQVDSFFDVTYQIEFVGCPGSVLEGFGGTTTNAIRWETGDPPPQDCGPNFDGTACIAVDCPDPNEQCVPRCVNVTPATGDVSILDCDCRSRLECRVALPDELPLVCIVPDNGNGTAAMPPAGCEYTAPDDVMYITEGLPADSTLELVPTYSDFICPGFGPCTVVPPQGVCEAPGGTLGGDAHCYTALLRLDVTGTGGLAGLNRILFVQVHAEVHTAPRSPGDPVQSFDAEMFRLEGELFGDPDFCTFRVRAGSDLGLPSPGHMTLTEQGGNFQVDSFFDVAYQIEFVGCPGSVLEGFGGTTTNAIRWELGGYGLPLPACVGDCPLGMTCREDVVQNSDGTYDLCCDCVPIACSGDANCDGQIDFGDINAFVAALVDGIYCDGSGANADVNENGSVGFEDINPFVALLTQNPLPIPCP